jgi:CubicO group peptidase (beta-lactamase class C family)
MKFMKRLFKLLLLILILGLLFWLALPKQQKLSENLTTLDEYIPALMTEAAIPGIAIAKISNGENTLIKTYGYANIEKSVRVDENTLFNIASISKPIMGIALLKLVDSGQLDLDTNINDYLSFAIDNPNTQDEIITIRHLATHSSGIADYYDTSSYAINQDSNTSLKDHLKSLLTPTGKLYAQGAYYLNAQPGQVRKYSNLAAALAGHIIQETTGLSLADYSRQVLFPLLNMPQSSWLLNDLNQDTIAVPYEVEQCIPYLYICTDTEATNLNFIISKYFNPPMKNKEFIPYPHFGNPQYPDGGIRTSIKELSNMLTLVLNNQDSVGNNLLSKELYTEMFSLQLPQDISDSQRFFWRDQSGMTGHMGSDLGVFTALYFDIQSKTGFIILMNRGMDGKSAKAAKDISLRLMSL